MFNREWLFYFVRAVLREKPPDHIWPVIAEADRLAHQQAILPDWETQIFVFPRRVLCLGTFSEIANIQRNGKSARIYPPFPLDEKAAGAGLMTDAKFPHGKGTVEGQTPLSTSAVKGLNIEPRLQEQQFSCRGLRIDMQFGFPSIEVFKLLTDQLTLHTRQWWLRLGYDPFSGPIRLSADVNRDFAISQELRFHGAGDVQSAWRAANATQKLAGFELPLTEQIWRSCTNHLRSDIPAEAGILSFLDAVSHYMAGEDARAILGLALSFEILGNKHHFAKTSKYLSNTDKLQRVSALLDGGNRGAIHDLFIDRGHVAHGRPPYLLGKAPEKTIESYLEAVLSVVNNYLQQLAPGTWPTLSRLNLESTRKR